MNPLDLRSDRRVDAVEWPPIATIFLAIPMHVLRARYRHLNRLDLPNRPASLAFLLLRLVSGRRCVTSPCIRNGLYHGRKFVSHSTRQIHLLFLFPPLILLPDDNVEAQLS